MKYVTAVWDDGGFYVDPSAYLAELQVLGGDALLHRPGTLHRLDERRHRPPRRDPSDEEGGCLHEIALTDASITVRCEDLQAVWGDAG